MARRERPRRYDLQPPTDVAFSCAEIALGAAALDELRARVIDQIEDLPPEALSFVPDRTTLSIAALVEHLVWAELDWIKRASGAAAPDDLSAEVEVAGRAVPAGDCAPLDVGADVLVTLCHRIRDEFTVPALARLSNPEARLVVGGPALTLREVLLHLAWHWTYHSGQIGLLRELWGAGYGWRFGP
ncbi:MAG: DUF664 domain-containing protein [Anaerolineae bacterium]|jgi:uncharacterized damage-inducible protein DinB|nr:DUF664 domain-containing protein [Anaerolineae bacterium]